MDWGVEYAKPALLSSFIAVCSILNIKNFNRFGLKENSGIPTKLNYFLLTQRCKVTLPSQWNIYCASQQNTPSPGMTELRILNNTASTVRVKAMTVSHNFHTYNSMSQQGSPARQMVQQALPVDHSNVLKPRRLLQSIETGGFTCY